MPIKYSSSPGRVLGVFQLVNKLHDLPFTSNDENFLEAFAIFCGMGISNVRMYETACVAMAKQQVLFKKLAPDEIELKKECFYFRSLLRFSLTTPLLLLMRP